jgi:hypothetical protein
MTYALLVPQSPYRIAAARGVSTFLGLFVFPTSMSINVRAQEELGATAIVTRSPEEVNLDLF